MSCFIQILISLQRNSLFTNVLVITSCSFISFSKLMKKIKTHSILLMPFRETKVKLIFKQSFIFIFSKSLSRWSEDDVIFLAVSNNIVSHKVATICLFSLFSFLPPSYLPTILGYFRKLSAKIDVKCNVKLSKCDGTNLIFKFCSKFSTKII